MVVGLGSRGRTEADLDKTLAHQTRELDGRFAVGPDVVRHIQLHGHVHFIFQEIDLLDAADLHAGHFDRIPFLEFLHGAELGVNADAALEEVEGADHFHDEEGGDQREREEDSQAGFECVFHNEVLSRLWLKLAVKNSWIRGCG